MATIMIGATILISCGGGGSGGSGGVDNTTTPSNENNTPVFNNEVTQVVSGLKTGTTYYWKVVADDGNGGITESEVRSFTTQ